MNSCCECTLILRPDADVVEEEKEEVIGNKILTRTPQVDWIPVFELIPELVELLFRNSEFRLVLNASLSKYVVPYVHRELLRPAIEFPHTRTYTARYLLFFQLLHRRK